MQKKINIAYNFVIIISIIASLSICFLSLRVKDDYRLVFLLPCIYTIMLLISKNNKIIIGNIGIFIINLVMFIRYIIYPLSLILTLNSDSDIGISKFIDTSIYLMIYECIAIFITLNWWGKQRLCKANLNISSKFRFYTKVDFAILISLGIFVVAILFNPNLLRRYLFVENIISNDKINGILDVFFNGGIDIVYIFILYYIFKTYNKSASYFGLILSLLISIIIVLGEINVQIGSISRWSFLIYSLTIIIMLSKLYNHYSKLILRMSIPMILISIILLTFKKFGGDLSIQLFFNSYLSTKYLDDYFMGIDNVCNGIAMTQLYAHRITFYTMLTDIFSAVPIASHFFDALKNSTNVFYHDFTNRTDNIIPTIVQSYSYFGFIGSPFFSIIFTVLTIELTRKINESKDVIMFFVLTLILIWFSLFMAININIILQGTWYKLIFLLLIILNNRYPIFRKNNTHPIYKRINK